MEGVLISSPRQVIPLFKTAIRYDNSTKSVILYSIILLQLLIRILILLSFPLFASPYFVLPPFSSLLTVFPTFPSFVLSLHPHFSPTFFLLFFFFSSPQLMVCTEHNRDTQYDLSVAKYVELSDKRAEQYEVQLQRRKDKMAQGDTHDVHRFLQEALGTHDVSTAIFVILLVTVYDSSILSFFFLLHSLSI